MKKKNRLTCLAVTGLVHMQFCWLCHDEACITVLYYRIEIVIDSKLINLMLEFAEKMEWTFSVLSSFSIKRKGLNYIVENL